jgi:chromosome segregation ATPase
LLEEETPCLNLEIDYAHDMVDLEKALRERTQEYHELKNSHAQQVLDLETELEKEIQRNTALDDTHEKELLSLNATLDYRKGEVHGLQEELGQMTEHAQQMEARHIHAVFDLKAKLNRRYSQIVEEVYGLQSEVETVKEELESKENTVEFYTWHICAKQQEVNSLSNKVDSASQVNSFLQHKAKVLIPQVRPAHQIPHPPLGDDSSPWGR